ncbi:MAG: dTMP kinase [Candidatus Pacearchaeota archaeon]
MRGKFIVFEGIDGCGKTTELLLLSKYIFSKNKYNNIILTREPYKLLKIRELLNKIKSPYEKEKILIKLFIEDRKIHIKEIIKPALKRNFYVLSDRYKYSTIAYQAAQGVDIKKLINLNKNFIIPDIVFIIDVPVSLSLKRMLKEKRTKQKFENDINFLEKVRNNYLKLPLLFPNEKIYIIDGTKRIEKVYNKIKSIYEKEIEK